MTIQRDKKVNTNSSIYNITVGNNIIFFKNILLYMLVLLQLRSLVAQCSFSLVFDSSGNLKYI